ncbi:MAG: ABC transporter permease [Armatimonadota bacterium]
MARPGLDAVTPGTVHEVPPAIQTFWQAAWRRFRRHRLAAIGGGVFGLLIVLAIIYPEVAGRGSQGIALRNVFRPPSRAHPFGTDELGRDVLARLLGAGRVSLAVGIVATTISTTLGTVVGFAAGFYGSLVDVGLMRLVEMFLSIPSLAVMFVLARFLGPSLSSIILVLCLFGWMFTARLVRGEVLRLKHLDFVEAARAIGASNRRIIAAHLLPNVLPPIIVAATIAVGQAILAESTISYFGLGIQPPVASWGNMLQNAQEYLWSTPWLALYPGCAILMTVLSINLLGDGLRDALDPVSRR